MNTKRILMIITICFSIIYNNTTCFNFPADAIKSDEQLNIGNRTETIGDNNKLRYYDDLNFEVGKILQQSNNDKSINYIDLACSYEKEDKLLTFDRIAEIKQQLSINELRIVQEYLFIFGTFTCDQDMRDAYQNVVSLFENNNLELFSVNDYNINSNNSSYSSSKAVAYAHKYYENYNPNYEDFTLSGGDCCNFVSQCLKAGGFSTTDNWYYNTKNDYSSSWINCSYLLPYLKNNAYNYDYYSASYYRKYSRNITKAMKINAGDVVIVCTYAGIFDLPWHALFVTSVNNYEVRCASHTDDYYSKAIVTNTGISDDDYLYFIDIKKDPYTYK